VRHVTASRIVDAPIQVVWSLLAAFHHWPAWGPSIQSVEAFIGPVS
jgi:uncharacterized protein YndB with AHSA1/START domain